MGELDVNSYNQLILREKYIRPVSSQADFTTIVKEALNEQIGSEIVGIQAVTSILDDAISRNHTRKTTPILLSTGDEKLALDLLRDLGTGGNRVLLVLAGKASKAYKGQESINVKEVTEESVKSALDSIKSSLKK